MMISSPHMLRRFCCFTTVVASSSSSNTQKKRLVFMGSPQVSASVLDNLLTASSAPESIFEMCVIGKINPEESWLSFEENATVLHNKVRAFAGWPGTRAKVSVIDGESDHRTNSTELKIITTRVLDSEQIPSGEMDDDVFFSKGSLIFCCGEGTALEVLEVQLPGKRVVGAAAFWNGLRGRKLKTIN